MNYTLMHKNTPVADFRINETFQIVDKVVEVYSVSHIPLGTIKPNGQLDIKLFNDWFFSRGIPESREGIKEALRELHVQSAKKLLLKCHGLSLTDHYWFSKKDEPIQWETINYFDHEFSDDIGIALFGKDLKRTKTDFDSPDTTSNGNLRKRWAIRDGKRVLIKAGKGPLFQEPLNEVIASVIMDKLDIPHVAYTLEWENKYPVCICDDFINRNTEYISAANIIGTMRKDNADSLYDHLLKCYASHGLTDGRSELEKMITIDYLIGNRDRHLNNFGIIRDTESLQWVGIAPVYDSGSSLWNESGITSIKPEFEIESMPFRRKHSTQIQLVKSFEWIDFNALSGIDQEIDRILKQSPYIDDERRTAICEAVTGRIKTVREVSTGIQTTENITKKYYKESNSRKYRLRHDDDIKH